MLRRLLLGVFVLVFISCLYSNEVLAKGKGSGRSQGKSQRSKKMDRNDDGMVDNKEKQLAREKKLENKEKQVNNWWRKRADTDNDGKVTEEEKTAWKKMTRERIDMDGDGVISAKEKRLSWRHAKSKVNTSTEKQYDSNNDGWLDPDETKSLLEARRSLVKSKGKAKVDSVAEAGYDENDNGVIDAEEAAEMDKDI